MMSKLRKGGSLVLALLMAVPQFYGTPNWALALDGLPSIVVNDFTIADRGQYRVEVSNLCGTLDGGTIEVTVNVDTANAAVTLPTAAASTPAASGLPKAASFDLRSGELPSVGGADAADAAVASVDDVAVMGDVGGGEAVCQPLDLLLVNRQITDVGDSEVS
jgi:hypothetical protein